MSACELYPEPNIHCEWGVAGAASLRERVDVLVVVDVLSFSTCLDAALANGFEILPYPWIGTGAARFAADRGAELAGRREAEGISLSPSSFAGDGRGRSVVLPSPNGAAITIVASPGAVLSGCLRNAASVARAATRLGRRIGVVPAGKRWPDRSLRPAIEDWLGAGAIIAGLPGHRSPEAELAAAAFAAAGPRLSEHVFGSVSGKELADRGFVDDVAFACKLDVSETVPAFDGDRYRALDSSR